MQKSVEKISSEISEEENNKKKENLEINPFPEIFSEEEFLEIKEEGKNFLKDYIKEKDAHINSLVDADHIYSAYLDRMKLDKTEKSIIKGEITENYENTIISQDDVTLSTLNEQKIETIGKFFEGIDSVDPEYDEELNSDEMFYCYKEDLSGKPNNGIDIEPENSHVVYASRKGKVEFSQQLKGYGYTIILKHPRGLNTVYSNLSSSFVNEEDQVTAKQAIGEVGKDVRTQEAFLQVFSYYSIPRFRKILC